MLEEPLLVKRPVLQMPGQIVVGFSEALYAGLFE